jgi:polysaccharide pyruvyl transferase WcaK-like protein
MAVCSGASLVLAMRLHGLILSALSGAPCAALSYDPKVAAAAADLGCPCHSLDASPSPGMLASWDAALDTPPPASRLLELRQQTEVHRHVLALLDANDPGC